MPTAGSLDLPSFAATVGHRAGAGGSAQWRGEQRHHARAARKAGAALRAVSTGVDSAPRGIDRPRLQVPHRPAKKRSGSHVRLPVLMSDWTTGCSDVSIGRCETA